MTGIRLTEKGRRRCQEIVANACRMEGGTEKIAAILEGLGVTTVKEALDLLLK